MEAQIQASHDQLRNEFSRILTELRQEVAIQRSQIKGLQEENQELLRRAQTSRPKPALPHPEKFGGSSTKFDTWLPAIRAKLRTDSEALGDDIAKFYYVYLNLES